jgi:uncharacterized protein
MSGWLIVLFALVAVIYASVGFGGGSTYTALLAVAGINYQLIPVISLLCNIIVVTGGCIRFARAGLLSWRSVLPLIAITAPFAFLGGLVPLKEAVFMVLLGVALLASSIALFFPVNRLPDWRLPMPALLVLSALVGLLAGLSGIGGGIFMAPFLHLTRWADARRIAAFASLYILVNSITGVTGQLIKGGAASLNDILPDYWPLMAAVFVGGQIGSMIGLKLFPEKYLRWVTALLVGYVAIRLLWPEFGALFA